MSVLLLVRHGQASFGAEDYDALSEKGHEQAERLGRSLAERGIAPDLVLRGDLRRHRETAEGVLAGLGLPDASVPVEVDAGWDEFDFDHVLDVHLPRDERLRLLAGTPATEHRAVFQTLFEKATARWLGGASDEDYHETYAAFAARCRGATDRTATRAREAGARTVLVVSSGGPIAMVASQVLTGGPGAWPALNRVTVNAAVTKVLAGRSGLTLSTFNEHAHLGPDLTTYR
ncbi:MAG: histidine phosphatase family protein [Nocardioides sp.]|uniref:histidine phosphatase family protein n=1 Tax=Nocardioides sp. TaxID=35761 RepID=UPI0039E3ADAB